MFITIKFSKSVYSKHMVIESNKKMERKANEKFKPQQGAD